MSSSKPEARRVLATVLAADAVGFSRRMEQDRESTVRAIIECRALLSELVAEFHGRTIGTPGDFFLAVMPSGTEAVGCAVRMQEALAMRNLAVGEALRAEYRIGIGVGDVYESGGDLLGDAVNIASRLQTIAPAGGIVASGAVRDVVGSLETIEFEYLGDQVLKNLAMPVRAYQVVRVGADSPAAGRHGPRRGEATLRAPIKPVIEVAPFRARSAAEDEKLFAAALVDEVTTILAGLSSSLLVRQLDREDQFSAISAAGDAPRLYRLSGSVQRAGSEMRIAARLTKAESGEAIWADKLDYRAEDAFDAQELIAREVVTAIQVTLTEGEQAQSWRKGTNSTRAWELFQRGHDHEQRFTREGHQRARELYEAALEHDPGYVSAIVALAFCHLDEIRLGWCADVDAFFARAETLYDRASVLAPEFADCHALLAFIELHRRNDRQALEAMERAVRLAPRNGQIAACLGYVYETFARYDDAIEAYRRAILLNFHFPAWIAVNLGFAQCVMGRLNEARQTLLGVVQNQPRYARAYLILAVVYRRLGLMSDAMRAAGEVRRLDPLFSIKAWAQDRPYADKGIVEAFMADLQAVGLDL